jgi:hypothetical protein
MPGYASYQQIGNQPPTDIWTPDTVQKHALGEVFEGYSPDFGWGKFVYGKAAAAQEAGSVVVPTDLTWTMTDLPNTASQGFAVYVARANMASGAYGWYQFAGTCPVSASASVAAGAAVGVTAAGQIGAYSTLKAIIGVRVMQPSTYAPTKTGTTTNGSKDIRLNDVTGLFVGLPVSGTGIAGGSTIAAIDPSGFQITLNNAATASGTVTLTFTHTGFLICNLNAPHCQGAVA